MLPLLSQAVYHRIARMTRYPRRQALELRPTAAGPRVAVRAPMPSATQVFDDGRTTIVRAVHALGASLRSGWQQVSLWTQRLVDIDIYGASSHRLLRAYVEAPGISRGDRDDRRELSVYLHKLGVDRTGDSFHIPNGKVSITSGNRSNLARNDLGDHVWTFRHLTALPPFLICNGSLSIRSATLRHMPLGLDVAGDLNLYNCSGLIGMDGPEHVGANLTINQCNNLRVLPQRLRVGHSIQLTGLDWLMTTPSELNAGESVSILSCPHLRQLGAGWRIGNDLQIRNCPSLEAIDDDIHVSGRTEIRDCPSMSSRQRNVFDLNRPSDRSWSNNISFNGDALRPLSARIQNQRRPNLLASQEMNAYVGGSMDVVHTMGQWYSWAGSARAPQLEEWQLNASDSRIIARFLYRLREAEDFSRRGERAMAHRICAVIDAMHASPPFRAQCIEMMSQNIDNCGDRVAMGLSHLEIAARVEAATRSHQSAGALTELARGLIKLDVVYAAAARLCSQGHLGESAEVYLFLEMVLGPRLSLPVNTHAMRYTQMGASCVTSAQVEATATTAILAAQDPVRLAQFLHTWAPWQAHLRRQQSSAPAGAYAGLPQRLATQFGVEARICPFTLEGVSELAQPVYVDFATHTDVFEFAALMQWWTEHGTHPIDRKSLAFTSIYRLRP